MPAESDFDASRLEPTRALLLAHALDTCIQAEREVPGSADLFIAQQPAWARAELRRLVGLAGSLEAAASSGVPSDEFRVSARVRLMRRIAGATGSTGLVATLPSRNGYHPVTARGRARWLWRGSAGGLLAAALLLGATITASANALPGDPLYAIKQAREEIGVRFAADDQSRALALLAQANARLDETARLLDAGRTDQAAQTTQQFDDALDRATVSYVVTITGSSSEDQASSHMQSELTQQQQELQTLLQSAPEPARADLRQALVATERSRALVTDPKPVQAALGHRPERAEAAAPTVAAESVPTELPTPVVVAAERAAPLPIDLVAQPTREPVEADDQEVVVQAVIANPPAPAPAVIARRSSSSSSRGRGPQQAPVVESVPDTAQAPEQSHDQLRDDHGPPEVADHHDDGPGASPVIAQQTHADDDHGRVVEQPTPVPVAHAAQSASPGPSAPAPAVVVSRDQSHDAPTARQQTQTTPTNSSSNSATSTSAATARAATPVTAKTGSGSNSGGDDAGHAATSVSASSAEGGHTTTATSPASSNGEGEGGHSGGNTSGGSGGNSSSGSGTGGHSH